MTWLGIEHTTLVYWEDALTNIPPGQNQLLFKWKFICCSLSWQQIKVEGQWLKEGVGSPSASSLPISMVAPDNLREHSTNRVRKHASSSNHIIVQMDKLKFCGAKGLAKGLSWLAGKGYMWGRNKASYLCLFSHLPFSGWTKSLSHKQTTKNALESLMNFVFRTSFCFE